MKTTYEHFVFIQNTPYGLTKTTCLVRDAISQVVDMIDDDELYAVCGGTSFCFGGEFREKFLQWWERNEY
jgi:hypothetical protein